MKCYVQLSIVDLKVEVISERDSSEEDGGASHHAASYNSLNCVKEHRVQNLFVTVNSKNTLYTSAFIQLTINIFQLSSD